MGKKQKLTCKRKRGAKDVCSKASYYTSFYWKRTVLKIPSSGAKGLGGVAGAGMRIEYVVDVCEYTECCESRNI